MSLHPISHPDEEAILRWITGEMIGSQARALEQHVADCETCSERLAAEAALDVVMHAAAELDPIDDMPVVLLPTAPAISAPRVGVARGWRQALAAAAAVVLVALAGQGMDEADGLDRIEAPTRVVASAAPQDGPASWESLEILADPICEAPDEGAGEDATLCVEPAALLAMADVSESAPSSIAPWSIAPWSSAPWSIASEYGITGEDGCTTPVDTGESLTCDDWLSADDLAG